MAKLFGFRKIKQVVLVISKKVFGRKWFVNVQNNFVSGTLKPAKHVMGNLAGFIKGQR